MIDDQLARLDLPSVYTIVASNFLKFCNFRILDNAQLYVIDKIGVSTYIFWFTWLECRLYAKHELDFAFKYSNDPCHLECFRSFKNGSTLTVDTKMNLENSVHYSCLRLFNNMKCAAAIVIVRSKILTLVVLLSLSVFSLTTSYQNENQLKNLSRKVWVTAN